MYVTSLHIENLRCFASADLELQYPGRVNKQPLRLPNINLLLGNNGSGKTTTLKAIAMAVLSPVINYSGLIPYRLIRHSASADLAEVKAKVSYNEQDDNREKPAKLLGFPPYMDMAIVRHNGSTERFSAGTQGQGDVKEFFDQLFDESSTALLVVGYGATRRVEDSKSLDIASRRKMRSLRYERVSGLFENYVSLIPLTAWLPQYKTGNPVRYKQVVNLINRLLPENARFLAELEQGDYLFEVNGTPAPFGALSDGYQAYIGWIADLLYHICTGAPKGAKLINTHGIVLVDEIDLHLHPDWQRSVIPTIAEALPNLQFVFTTHSPIVAGSVEKENIYVMETTADGASVVRQYNESIYGLNAEEILLSPYFNLPTTRAVAFEGKLKSLSVKAGRGDLDAALAFMEQLANPSRNGTSTKTTAKALKANTSRKTKKKTQPRKPAAKASTKPARKK